MTQAAIEGFDTALDSRGRVKMPSGRHIHLRLPQTIAWGVVAGALGALIVAGGYFALLEMNWHVFSLKAGWDNLFSYSWWPTYRHTAFRDLAEPAFAVMGVKTLMAKQKYWGERVSTLRLATAPFILILMTFALGIAGTFLLNYAFPHPILQQGKVGNLLVGAGIGLVLHRFWAPIGATLQGMILDDTADRAANKTTVPLWVKYPLSPPVIRERFMGMYRYSLKSPGISVFTKDHTTARKWIVIGIVFVAALLAVLGFLGHYWVGTLGHTIGWFQPVG